MTFVMRAGRSHEWKEAKKQNKEKGEERNGGRKGGDGKAVQQERNQNREGLCLRLLICSALFCPAMFPCCLPRSCGWVPIALYSCCSARCSARWSFLLLLLLNIKITYEFC